jgi:aerotaxis receptor
MKRNLPVTQNEHKLTGETRIVSTTDLKGALTYANQDFLNISGFSEDELLGHNHNIVRHPDMPPAAFQNLWDDIKQGKSWMGIVKNRCKNGDYYWVDAFVTPIKEGNQVTGYQSVRLRPEEKYVKTAEAFYKRLWKPMPLWRRLVSKLRPALMGRIWLANFISVTAGAMIALGAGARLSPGLFIGLLAMLITGGVFAKLIARPWQKAAAESKSIIDNPVTQHVYSGRHDELGQLQMVMRMQQVQQETVVWRINDAINSLQAAAAQAMAATEQVEMDMDRQKSEVEQVATAMNEMTATVQEVARNTAYTADATVTADGDVRNGKQVVDRTIVDINNLAGKVEEAVSVIQNLARDSEQIGGVVDVIRGIAEQTNLLALNAAIEAARAGEQGRGFAVVADEVRTLASRTQNSTDEIQQMVQELQTAAENAVMVMEQGQAVAQMSVDQAAKAGESLGAITRSVDTISDMSNQIATAAEEQSAVSDEINQNIVNINGAAEHTLNVTRDSTLANQRLNGEINKLKDMVKQFGLSH